MVLTLHMLPRRLQSVIPKAALHYASRAPLSARCAQPYQLQFQDVHFGATFHQCVYIRIQPGPHVMHAGAETRAAFGGDRDATYMPHLSLLYSAIDEDARCGHRCTQSCHDHEAISSIEPLRSRTHQLVNALSRVYVRARRKTLAEQQQDRCLLLRQLAILRMLCADCKSFRRIYRFEAPRHCASGT